MKVKLLKEVGIHPVGTILDVDSTFVLQLERDGIVTMNLDINAEKAKIEEPGQSDKVYTDLSGKTYTEDEVSKMDKRTNIYKEIQANLKK